MNVLFYFGVVWCRFHMHTQTVSALCACNFCFFRNHVIFYLKPHQQTRCHFESSTRICCCIHATASFIHFYQVFIIFASLVYADKLLAVSKPRSVMVFIFQLLLWAQTEMNDFRLAHISEQNICCSRSPSLLNCPDLQTSTEVGNYVKGCAG